MFSKKLAIQFVKPDEVDSFAEHAVWFEYCVAEWNRKCSQSRVNEKRLENIEYRDDEIVVDLLSEIELTKAPGRALSQFSRLLVAQTDENAEIFDSFFLEHVFHGKLFTIAEVEEETSIEDEDVVKILVDFLVTPKSTMPESAKNAFGRIKKIVSKEILPVVEREG